MAKPVIAQPETPSDDFFNPEKLRLKDAALGEGGVRQQLAIAVTKPRPTWFFRAHPDPAFRIEGVGLLEAGDGMDRELYLVDPDLVDELSTITQRIQPATLLLCTTRTGDAFLWPIKLPTGRRNEWLASAAEGANLAAEQWVRLEANIGMGRYDAYVAAGDLGEPRWPDAALPALLEKAFGDRTIRRLDHPVINELRGLGS